MRAQRYMAGASAVLLAVSCRAAVRGGPQGDESGGTPAARVSAAPGPNSTSCDWSAYRPLEGSWEAQVEQKATPSYPPEAQAAGTGGTVLVRLLVDGSGTPVRVCAISGPEVLRGTSEQAALLYRFKPPFLNGEAVPFVVQKVAFTFKPRSE